MHLAITGFAAELHRRLVDESVAVGAAGRELAAVRVERQLTVERDAGAAVDEVLAFADRAESERLDPREAVEA